MFVQTNFVLIMKTILTLGASNSKNSINKEFACYTATLLDNVEVKNLDLNDFSMPLYGIDEEETNGVPAAAHSFRKEIMEADGIIISFAEHNGSFSAAFKNVYDWASRAGGNVWQNKPLLLLATSPGGRGGQSVLEHAYNIYAHGNENTIKGIAFPSFHNNFAQEKGILNEEYRSELKISLKKFQDLL